MKSPEPRLPLLLLVVADRVGLGPISSIRVGCGVEFADCDHDGWLESVVAGPIRAVSTQCAKVNPKPGECLGSEQRPPHQDACGFRGRR